MVNIRGIFYGKNMLHRGSICFHLRGTIFLKDKVFTVLTQTIMF